VSLLKKLSHAERVIVRTARPATPSALFMITFFVVAAYVPVSVLMHSPGTMEGTESVFFPSSKWR
jgi:hypothetical protein